MIGARTRSHFDTKLVLDRVETGVRSALLRQAQYGRVVARRSMRRRKKASPPGTPPSVHSGQVKNLLFYALDTQGNTSAVVGPTLWGNSTGTRTVPQTLEEGGEALVKAKARTLKIGDAGIVRLGGPHAKSVRGVGTTVSAAFAKIRSSAQLARAQALENQVFGTGAPRTIHIAARPFMGPALAETNRRFAEFWQDSVK